MAIMRVHKTGNYTIMSNHHFKQKEMSLKAKGLLSMMLSLPDDWDYSIMGLVQLSKDGKDSVMSALQELERFGYLSRTRLQDEKGKFMGYDYDIWESPEAPFANPCAEKPCAENPNTGKPNAENPTQLNTNKINSEGIKSLSNKEKKDKNDKEDKRASAQNGNDSEKLSTKLSTSDGELSKEQILEMREAYWMKENRFVAELLKVGYIQADEIFIDMYDRLFRDLVDEKGFDIVRSCLAYFTKRLVDGKAYDEQGNEIQNKFAYLRKSLDVGITKIEQLNDPNFDPFSEEACKRTLEKMGFVS